MLYLRSIRSNSVGTFLIVFGAMALTISLFGTSLPFFDEWDAEAIELYKPFIEGNFEFNYLFAPHNGHRIVLTRLTALILFVLNGGWDPELQMLASGFLHALTAALLIHSSYSHFNKPAANVLTAFTLVLFATPFSWMSILVAFQTQFYFMLTFSVIALIALSSKNYVLGYCFAALSFLSMTSGALVLPAFASVLIVDAWRSKSIGRQTIIHLGICAALFLLFMVSRLGLASSDAVYAADSFRSFSITLITAMTWPFRARSIVGLVIYLPFLFYLLRTFLVTNTSRLIAALGVFVLLQLLAMAVFRGEDGVPPSNRYWEILLLGIWVNGICALILTQNKPTRLLKYLLTIWAVVAAIGMSGLAHESLTKGLVERKAQNETARSLIEEYLVHGDVGVFDDVSDLNMSYPNSERLTQILSDPVIQSILPSSLNPKFQGRLDSIKYGLFRFPWVFILLGIWLVLKFMSFNFKKAKNRKSYP